MCLVCWGRLHNSHATRHLQKARTKFCWSSGSKTNQPSRSTLTTTEERTVTVKVIIGQTMLSWTVEHCFQPGLLIWLWMMSSLLTMASTSAGWTLSMLQPVSPKSPSVSLVRYLLWENICNNFSFFGGNLDIKQLIFWGKKWGGCLIHWTRKGIFLWLQQ